MKLNKVPALLLAGAISLSSASTALANVNNTNLDYMSTLQNESSVSKAVEFYFDGIDFIHSIELLATEDSLICFSLLGAIEYHTIYEGTIINHLFIYNDKHELVGVAIADNSDSTIVNGVQNRLEVDLSSNVYNYKAFSEMTLFDPTDTYVHHDILTVSLSGSNIENNTFSNLILMQYEEAIENNGMIKAKNTQGISGYVYAREISRDYNNLTNDVRFINLYDADGITVIGEFQIG